MRELVTQMLHTALFSFFVLVMLWLLDRIIWLTKPLSSGFLNWHSDNNVIATYDCHWNNATDMDSIEVYRTPTMHMMMISYIYIYILVCVVYMLNDQ